MTMTTLVSLILTFIMLSTTTGTPVMEVSGVIGTFPTTPTYGIQKYFADASCEEYTFGEAILLNACLQISATTSAMYTCGKYIYVIIM